MKGVFFNSKNTFARICIIVGGILITLFTARIFVNSESPLHIDDIPFAIVCICFGMIAVAFGVLLTQFNRGAYVTVTGDHISAKYNWNKKIMLYFNEIAFVGSQTFTLNIRAKNGKRYVIGGLINADTICDAIRKKMPYEVDKTIKKEALIFEIDMLAAKRKKEIIGTVVSIILMFLNIFLCTLLTGEKDMSDFTRNDWIVFVIFCVTEILIVSVTFYFSKIGGEKLNILKEKSALLRIFVIFTTPTLPGNLVSSYMDSKYETRTTVFGFPNSNDLYFCIEEVDWKYDLVCTYRSPIYSNPEDFKEDLTVDNLIKIK